MGVAVLVEYPTREDELVSAADFSPEKGEKNEIFMGERSTANNSSDLLVQNKLKQNENSETPWFTGTTMERRSDGSDVLENVCFTMKGALGATDSTLRSYSRNSANVVLHNSLHPSWAAWTKTTAGYSLAQWHNDSAASIFIPEETVLLLTLFNNPGHCLNDQVFSLTHGIMNTTKDRRSIVPQYQRFLLVGVGSSIEKSCDKMTYCCELLQMAGLIDPTSIIKVRGRKPVCFSKLFVPRIGAFRFPSTNSSFQAISALRQRTFRQTGLPDTEWTAAISAAQKTASKPTIFLYDREGTRRRVLANSGAIKSALEAQYHATVDLWGSSRWSTVGQNVTRQAEIYNSQQYIIAPHGAHLANLFFVRPGTKIIEIQCALPPNTRNPNDVNWFSSFGSALSSDYYTYVEHEGCLQDGVLLGNYSPNNMTVKVSAFVDFVAASFHLDKIVHPRKP